MDKPLSQERLSEDDLSKWKKLMSKRSDSTSSVVLILIREVKRLQAIEAERDQYKEAFEQCEIGSNSLASVLIGLDLPQGWQEWTVERASGFFYSAFDEEVAYRNYETWLCYHAIREAGKSFEGVDTNETH